MYTDEECTKVYTFIVIRTIINPFQRCVPRLTVTLRKLRYALNVDKAYK